MRVWDQYIFTIFLDPFHEHQMLEPNSFILILFKPFLILFTMGLVTITSTFRSLMLPCMFTFISIWMALVMHMKIFMEFPKFQIPFFCLNNYLVLSLLNVGKFTLSTVLHKWNVHLCCYWRWVTRSCTIIMSCFIFDRFNVVLQELSLLLLLLFILISNWYKCRLRANKFSMSDQGLSTILIEFGLNTCS